MEKKKIYIDEISEDIQGLLVYNFEERDQEFEQIKNYNNPLLLIWRVEKLQLIKDPESYNSIFYSGDSYLILKINSEESKIIHIWVGKESSKDEIQFVNFKAFQLDCHLGNSCSIIYENQGRESSLFLSYFPNYSINEGGIDAFLESSQTSTIKAKLLHVHSKGAKITLKQVPINKKSLDSTDTFLFDTGAKIFIWRGSQSNGFEKFHVNVLSEKVKAKRYGKSEIIAIDEDCSREKEKKDMAEFYDLLQRFEEDKIEEKINEKGEKENFTRKIMKLSDESGKLQLTEEIYERSSLNSNDTFLIDRGDAIIIWIGKNTTKNEKRYGRFYANRYLVKEKRPIHLNIIVINEGKLTEELDKCFNK